MYVGHKEEGVAVLSFPTRLHEEAIGIFDGQIVGQSVLFNQIGIPFDELVVFRLFDQNESIREGL